MRGMIHHLLNKLSFDQIAFKQMSQRNIRNGFFRNFQPRQGSWRTRFDYRSGKGTKRRSFARRLVTPRYKFSGKEMEF